MGSVLTKKGLQGSPRAEGAGQEVGKLDRDQVACHKVLTVHTFFVNRHLRHLGGSMRGGHPEQEDCCACPGGWMNSEM